MRRSCSCPRSTVPSSWRRTIQAVPAAGDDQHRERQRARLACSCASPPPCAEMTPRRSAISSPPITQRVHDAQHDGHGMLTRMPATATSSTAPPSTIACVPSPSTTRAASAPASPTCSDSVADAGSSRGATAPSASRPPHEQAAAHHGARLPQQAQGPIAALTSTIRSKQRADDRDQQAQRAHGQHGVRILALARRLERLLVDARGRRRARRLGRWRRRQMSPASSSSRFPSDRAHRIAAEAGACQCRPIGNA
jgi:hypothetical protein